MLTRLLRGLFRRQRQTIGDVPQPDAAPIGPAEFYRALRAGDQRPETLVAHARWLIARDPLTAAELLQEASRRQPASALPLYWLGELHLGLGNRQSAAECFHAALLRDEGHAAAWQGLARARRAQERIAEADYAAAQANRLRGGRRALSAEFSGPTPGRALPDDRDWPAWQDFLAKAEHSPRLLEIEDLLETRAAMSPTAPAPHAALALWLVQHARPKAALDSALRAWDRDAGHPGAMLALATVHAAGGNVQEAASLCRQGLALHPADTGLAILIAVCLDGNNDAAALACYEEVLARQPARPATLLNNYGHLLNGQERFSEAIAPLREALAREPRLQKIRLNLAYALTYGGDRAEALALLDALLTEEPEHFEARWYRSHLRLALRDFPGGWQDYRYRFVAAASSIRPMPMPRWDGRPLGPRESLLVTAEQGVGDEIMFAACLGELASLASCVTLECDPRLYKLFARSFPHISLACRPQTNAEAPVAADCHIAAGDLPGIFRRDAASFRAARPPYLKPDEILAGALRQRLAALGPGRKIGISWRGGSATSRRDTRSLPLEELSPLLDVADCRFVSLQYGECRAEITSAGNAGRAIAHWPELIADLDAFAALVASLDLVITVCNATVHFAGALGRPTWVLTPLASEWRYTNLDDRMLWYPSVSLLRQNSHGEWNAVIAAAADKLNKSSSSPHRVHY